MASALGSSSDLTRLTILKRARSFYELAKPNLSALVVVSAVLGFYLGSASLAAVDWARMLHLSLGTALTAGGACAANMFLERDIDARMRRTCMRPIPSGRVRPTEALLFSLGIFCLGCGELAIFTGAIPAALSIATFLVYAFVYTPMKRRGPIAIWIGAVPGAIPPVMGWAAARGALGFEGLILFGILFVWQFPHFLALAWMYREDYERAGLKLLPSRDPTGVRTATYIATGCAALLVVSMMPAVVGMTGPVYAAGALVAGILFLWSGLRVADLRTTQRARSTFLASVAYLPFLLAIMLVDRM